jgi:hypothetical protein
MSPFPDVPEEQSLDHIRWIETDYVSGAGRIVLMNGRIVRIPDLLMAAQGNEMHPVTRSRWLPGDDSLKIWLAGGQVIFCELPDPTALDHRKNRPSVYLDQKDWSTLWKATEAPARVPEKERLAALRLIRLVESHKIILPLSSAHLLETGQWQDPKARFGLGLTILKLSKGWQLRHPLDVRRQELITVMSGRYDKRVPESRPVITLEADAAFQSSASSDSPRLALPVPVRSVIAAIVGTCATASTMLSEEDIRADVQSEWAVEQQRKATWIHGDKRARLTPAVNDAFTFSDAGKEIAIAAATALLSPEEMKEWAIEYFNDDLPRMPAFASYYEAIADKRTDPNSRWEQNDLTDLMFLSTGAAYADFTVGERKTIDLLKRAIRRKHKPTIVCSSIAELMTRPEFAEMEID